eukprot:TRINITY_DN2364_c0_g1_i1.p1 TRINITY_DN2364_c0_g1~~TRINITY_DN2364_c0_g1_i1.p1  ORF type:complete len:92 (-),score=19.04 TRINITY_DN2364_c0_g1_i1:229-504(-)
MQLPKLFKKVFESKDSTYQVVLQRHFHRRFVKEYMERLTFQGYKYCVDTNDSPVLSKKEKEKLINFSNRYNETYNIVCNTLLSQKELLLKQ